MVTIKDIAKLAGVGVGTVSRVLNDNPEVRSETREKVLKVIKEWNYIPNNSARNLKRNNTNSIGLLVKGIFNPFFSEIVKIISDNIDEKGYSVILHYNNDPYINDLELAVELAKEKKLVGIICLGGNFSDFNEEILDNLRIPMVLTSVYIEEVKFKDKFSSIGIENSKASYKAVDYLCKLGHKKIGIITTDKTDTIVGPLRIKGYKKALENNNLDFNESLISKKGYYNFQSGYDAMNELMDNNKGITAVFAISDIMAIGAIKAARAKGYKIPEDISIMGMDGIDYGKYYDPELTTILQPGYEMGRKSVDLLFDLLNNKSEHKHISLDTTLIERESCIRINR